MVSKEVRGKYFSVSESRRNVGTSYMHVMRCSMKVTKQTGWLQ